MVMVLVARLIGGEAFFHTRQGPGMLAVIFPTGSHMKIILQ